MLLTQRNFSLPLVVRMQNDMERLFGDLFAPMSVGNTCSEQLCTPLNIREDDTNYYIDVEIPGVNPDDLNITVTARVLTIEGEKKEETRETGGQYVHSERHFSSFRRTVRLPASVDTEQINAEHSQGVLSIRFGKVAQAVPKRIQVTSAD